MKKFISLIAIVLVLAMTALSLSSCANLFISEAALASISERILEGVNKISSATALDTDMKINAGFSLSDFSFISLVVPVDIRAQFNVADKSNPAAYFSMDTMIDVSALQKYNTAGASNLISNPNMNAALYYFDGAMYSSLNVAGEGGKTKTTVDLGGFSEITSMSLGDIQSLVFFDETMIKSASLRNGSDGSLTAKVTVDGEKALRSMLVVISGIFGSKSEILSDSAISSLLTESGMSVGDTKVSLTVDKDNNVTNFKMDSKISLSGIADISIALDADFNPVGEDFKVNMPEDPESYKEASGGNNDNPWDIDNPDDRPIIISGTDLSDAKLLGSENGCYIFEKEEMYYIVRKNDSGFGRPTVFPKAIISFIFQDSASAEFFVVSCSDEFGEYEFRILKEYIK